MISFAPNRQALENRGQPKIRCSRWYRKLQMASTSLVLENLTVLCLIDLSRAFDSVWDPGLFMKPIELGLPKCLIRSIKSFLEDRRTRACFENANSKCREPKQEHNKALCFLFSSSCFFINDFDKIPSGFQTSLFGWPSSLGSGWKSWYSQCKTPRCPERTWCVVTPVAADRQCEEARISNLYRGPLSIVEGDHH